MLEQSVKILPVLWIKAGSNARANLSRVAVQLESRCQRRADSPTDLFDHRGFVEIEEKNDEFITTKPKYEIAGTHATT